MNLVILSTSVFAVAWFGIFLIRLLAHRNGWVAQPRKDRWHSKPTALHGGVGFFPAFIFGAGYSIWAFFPEKWPQMIWSNADVSDLKLYLALVLGACLMFCLGWLDDIKHFRPSTKFIIQLIGASVVIFAGGIFPLTEIRMVNQIVTYLWFIGIINAVNMLDNMDGLSSGVVLIASGTLVLLTLFVESSENQLLAVPLALSLAACLCCFLIFNFPPASIFMGDSGSLSIGFILASLSIPSQLNGYFGITTPDQLWSPILVILIPATVLAIPIFDTTLVTITRRWRSQKASQGGRDHSSHRLVILGFSEKTTVLILYFCAIFGGSIAVVLQQYPERSIPVLFVFCLVLALSGVYLGHVKVQEMDVNAQDSFWTPLVSYWLYKRRAAEVILDLFVIVTCYFSAYLLRFEGKLGPDMRIEVVNNIPIVIPACLVAFFISGIYRGQWQFISITDIPRYFWGVIGGIVCSISIVTLVNRFGPGHSRSAFLIFGLLLFLMVMGTRVSFRLFEQIAGRQKKKNNWGKKKSVLIYGAGKGGKLLFEELSFNPAIAKYSVVGFIDDDKRKTGKLMFGLPIRKVNQWTEKLCKGTPEVWISSRYITKNLHRDLLMQWGEDLVIRRMEISIIDDRKTDETS
jgi:UDP-GlcNAc:undecaprenyl-phosphate/decaprenyl-phosphate GlcNAc-1-phosphate transferase